MLDTEVLTDGEIVRSDRGLAKLKMTVLFLLYELVIIKCKVLFHLCHTTPGTSHLNKHLSTLMY